MKNGPSAEWIQSRLIVFDRLLILLHTEFGRLSGRRDSDGDITLSWSFEHADGRSQAVEIAKAHAYTAAIPSCLPVRSTNSGPRSAVERTANGL